MSSEEVREDDEWLYEGGRGGGGEADNDTATLAKGENGEEDGDDDDDEHVGTPVAIDGQENGEEGTNTGAMVSFCSSTSMLRQCFSEAF